MKKLIVGILLVFISLPFFAQTNQGDKLIGGSANFGTEFIDNSDDIFFININPNYGKFVADNFAVGVNLGFGFAKLNSTSNTSFSLLPFGRYYFGESDVLQFYADVKAGLYLQSVKNNFGSNSETAFQIQFGPGVAFFLNENVSLDFLINYNYLGGDYDDKRLSFNFGFQIYLLGDGE